MKKPNGYWTKERCFEIALKYKNRNELRKNDASVYRIALNNKWLDEICQHMEYVNKYWTNESCRNEALKYDNRTDFQYGSKGAYVYAKTNNILNDICSHMINIGSKYYRCVYVFEFTDNCAYVGLTYNIKIREKEHNKKGPVSKHITATNAEYNLIQLSDYILVYDAQVLEEEFILKYRTNGWTMLNTNDISTIGGSTLIWTYEKCKKEAMKYDNRTKFINGTCAAHSAIRNGWYNEITSHMEFNKKKKEQNF